MNILTFLKYLRGIFNINLQSGTVHNAIIQSIYDSFIMVDGDIELMRLEMCLSTASGKWLDYWGDFFTVHRKLNEEDSAYAKRIIEYVIRPKTTIPSIKDYIVDFLNENYHTDYTREDVSIKEPWKDIGKLSHKGLLSRDARFFSGDYWCHSLMDISIPEKLTQELIDLVLSVKAAGVKIVWSFLNSYEIVKGFNESDDAWCDYARHIQTQVPRTTYSGLMLSNSSLNRTLSGRREIWFWMTNLYCWYAKMLEKDTDKSEVITPLDLAGLLDYYKIVETVFDVKDSGITSSDNPKGIMDTVKYLSGAKTEEEVVTRLIRITDDMLQSIKFVDYWIKLSQEGRLSQEGKLFDFRPAHELFGRIMETVEEFKENNRDYYSRLQPPIVTAEHIAMWYAAQNRNWLFNTPTMSQHDFYELWEMGNEFDHNTYEDITRFEDETGKRYLTFGDVYQPPIVIAGSPWDWTPIQDSPWLWLSATLNNEELEEIYRMKFSGFPDMVTIETDITTRPEYNFVLSDTGQISPKKYLSTTSQVHSSEPSLVLSDKGELNSQIISGEEIRTVVDWNENPDFSRYTYLSGEASIITKRRIVEESVPTLEKLIEFEENQCENGQLWNPNEDINYSTREWFQAPVQIGIYALWLITAHERQLWNTIAISNEEIEGYWNSPDGTGDIEAIPEYFEKEYTGSTTIYQPPIVTTDSPFYWTTESDIPWLWLSATLNNEELEHIYQMKFGDNPEVFPDIVEVVDVVNKTPEKAFRLSDNAWMNYDKVITTTKEYKNPDNGFILSQNSIISNRSTEYRTNIEEIPHPEQNFVLSDNGVLSNDKYELEVKTVHHTEDDLTVSDKGELSTSKQMSGGDIEEQHNTLVNPNFTGYHFMSGSAPEIVKTITEITYNDDLPLKYLSGDKTVTETKTTIIADTKGSHYMSGDKSTYSQRIEIQDHPPTLGKLIELEEQQAKVIYSMRDLLQAPILIMEYMAQWLVKPHKTQLWNTPIIQNRELLEYWEGENRPLTTTKLGRILLNDSIRYQMPIEMSPEPFYWIVRAHFTQLWNTVELTNEDILSYWEGDDKPNTVDDLANIILSDTTRYQFPIEMSPEPFYWIVPALVGRQLWNTIAISNEEILDYWEGANKPTEEEFEPEHLADERLYQPPIVMTDRPFYWLNDHTEFDTGWLWDSGTLTNGELEDIYRLKFSQYPDAFPDMVSTETVQVKHSEREFRLSSNGKLSAIYKKTITDTFTNPDNGFILSQNSIISNRSTEYRTNIEEIPHPEQNFVLSDNGTVSPKAKIVQIDLIPHPEHNLILSADGYVSTNKRSSGGKVEIIHIDLDNPEFNGYKYIDGNQTEIVKTTEEITYEKLPLKYMSGDKSYITTRETIINTFASHQCLSGDKTTTEVHTVFLENTPTLGKLIELEELEMLKYSHREQFQAPIVISDKEQAGLFVPANEDKLWNTPIMSNSQILSYWEGDDKPTKAYFSQNLLPIVPRYQPPVEHHFAWTSNGLNQLDNPWMWDSAILTNEDLEQVYESRFNEKNPTLDQIIASEEAQDPNTRYSIRGTSQSPVQITVK